MNIAVIGTGNVGGTLGKRWAQNGHQVVFGSHQLDSARVQEVVRAAGVNARAVTAPTAVAEAEVVVLTTPWYAAKEAIRAAGNLQHKIVIDCTNPLASGLSGLTVGQTT